MMIHLDIGPTYRTCGKTHTGLLILCRRTVDSSLHFMHENHVPRSILHIAPFKSLRDQSSFNTVQDHMLARVCMQVQIR